MLEGYNAYEMSYPYHDSKTVGWYLSTCQDFAIICNTPDL